MQDKDKNLPFIIGSPPSLLSKINGDAFASRSDYALQIDFIKEPPFFMLSPTHYVKS
jgi:oligopeptide transport system ATP-binding protein